MTSFWKNPDEELTNARKEKKMDLQIALGRPYALEVLRKTLDYLQAIRIVDKMMGEPETDSGMKYAIDLLRRCGDEVHVEKQKGQ